jgi:hypothetical protein
VNGPLRTAILLIVIAAAFMLGFIVVNRPLRTAILLIVIAAAFLLGFIVGGAA